VLVRGRGFEHEGLHQLSDRPANALDYGTLRGASRRALAQAGLSLADMALFQLYAPCTIVEVLASEALGLFAPGRGAQAAADGLTALGSRQPVNTCGGALSRGHPPEVTPLYDVAEATAQLLGTAGPRQVPDARFAMTVCELGKYNASLVHVLERAA
jgi:acetyl-CoA acetyltransferase